MSSVPWRTSHFRAMASDLDILREKASLSLECLRRGRVRARYPQRRGGLRIIRPTLIRRVRSPRLNRHMVHPNRALARSQRTMSSPSPHIATVQAMYAAFSRGDMPALLANVSDNTDWRINVDQNAPGVKRVPMFAPRQGHGGVLAFFSDISKGIEMHRFEPRSFLANDSQVAVHLVIDATVRSTGKRLNSETMHHFTFGPDGKLTRFVDFFDTLGEAASWNAVS